MLDRDFDRVGIQTFVNDALQPHHLVTISVLQVTRFSKIKDAFIRNYRVEPSGERWDSKREEETHKAM